MRSSARLHFAAAIRKAVDYDSGDPVIGFAVYDETGARRAYYKANTRNSGGSITKSMLLVAYLRQIGRHKPSSAARGELAAMIKRSDNDAANWVYSQLNRPRVETNRVARDADMTRFTLVVQPGYPYVIGQSAITAKDFASFFSKIFTMVPSAQRNFAKYLLAHLSDDDQKGMLQAGIHGVVYSKEGWTATDPGYAGYPYIVNQVARFNYGHTWYSVAVTVGHIADEATGETITKNIVHALVGEY